MDAQTQAKLQEIEDAWVHDTTIPFCVWPDNKKRSFTVKYLDRVVNVKFDDMVPLPVASSQSEWNAIGFLLQLVHEQQEQLDARNGIREPVCWFAGEMEKTLQANDDKGGWNNSAPDWLLFRMREEINELHRAMRKHEIDMASVDDVIREATDVANFAMMIADITRRKLEAAAHG